MRNYGKFNQETPRKRELNPIWRGIGCILIVIVTMLAYGLMIIFSPMIIATGKVPYQLLGYVHLPEWVFRTRILTDMAVFITSINNLWIGVIIFFVFLLILTTVTSLLYSMVYSLIGPGRYSFRDAPPSKYKTKKYTR